MQPNASSLEVQGEDAYGYIYRTVNEVNGMIYIGQHKGKFNPAYTGSGDRIQPAVKKYGKSNFSVRPIAWAKSFKDLNELEIYLLAFYRSVFGTGMLYNIADGGLQVEIPSRKGRRDSDLTRFKKSVGHKGQIPWMKGRTHTESTRAKLSAKLRWRTVTEKQKRIISKAQKGKIRTQEQKQHISLMNRGRKISSESIQMRSVSNQNNRIRKIWADWILSGK